MSEETTETVGLPVVNRLGVIAVVAVCGWLVMEMEILGARMLAPYFGSAIYVTMGSVIGVFLLSLSVGYMLGGWLSGRRDSQLILGLALAAAGAWLCALPRLVQPLCDRLLDAGFSDEWGSLVAALGLFGLPTVLLGMVSPTAVGWLTTRAERSGLNAGLVLAASTVASFVGTIVTAFYLLRLSVQRTVTVSGGVLIVLGAALVVRWAWRRTRRATPEKGE
ncbi:MAG: fused MFS/spermidine synthase [Candidatus Brocadiia bacterium]